MEDTYPCPACRAPADLVTGCSGCRRPPDPEAAEVIRLDREIVALGADVERARLAYADLMERQRRARERRAELAAAVRARVPVVAAPAPAPPRPLLAVPGGPETSTRTVQGLLFVLGGLLLGTAAVVFTAVAWASVGVAGRALILAAVTVLALAVPLLAARRGLRGTAETVAAVGLLLVLLDGYAAWSVDLAGVAGWPGTRYAALVGGASAAVALGYARISRLTGPWFAALLAAQPVLPLLAAEARPTAAGWAVVLVGVSLLDLAVLIVLTRRAADGGAARVGPAVVAGRAVAWAGFGGALLGAAGCALPPLAQGRAAGTPLLAGLPLLLVAAALAGAALLAGGTAFRRIATGLLVPALAAALLRPVAELRPSLLLLAAALVAAGLAVAVRLLPAGWRAGPRIAALLVALGAAALTGLLTALLALDAVARSLPPWHGAAPGPDLPWGWQLPLAVALGVGAVALLAPRTARPVAGPPGLALVALALPAAVPAGWPVAVGADLVAAVALLAAVVLRPAARAGSAAVGVAVLLGHALLVGMAAPGGALTVLAVVLVLGPLVAGLGRRAPGAPPAVTGSALLAGLLALPAAVTVALVAAGAPAWWQSRAALAAVGPLLVALYAVRRHWPDLRGYAATGLAVAATVTGLAPALPSVADPLAPYAALAVLLLAAGLPARTAARPTAGDTSLSVPAAAMDGATGLPARPPAGPTDGVAVLRLAGAALLAVAVVAAAPAVLRALLLPYRRVVPAWSGAPAAVAVPELLPAGLALATLAVAVVLAARAVGARRSAAPLAALPFAVAVPPVLLTAAGAPWPAAPAVALLTGLAVLLAAALLVPRPLLVPVAVPVGLPLVASGMAGLVATEAGTLAGLGVLLVAAATAGIAGRRTEARVVGCLSAVAAATGLAVTAPLAGDLPLRDAAFTVLAVAAVTLAAAALPARAALPGDAAAPGAAHPGGTVLVRRALDAAAQGVALVALLLTLDAYRHAAAVSVLWGAAVGLRLLRRDEPADRRWVFAGIAGGSELLGAWLLLAAGGVVLLEAYTLPAAALALAAGLVGLRTRPGLTSWLALGPGLGAALVPSLVSVLVAPDPQPWRRLLLGTAALGAVLAGASRRWQAPVLLGGSGLALLALHELVRGWDLLPRWIFLAAGGLALIGLAATYERRRRDLRRLRVAVGRMT
ncbi:SCO7613 C-terminal domain-containing membrane protein [Micromonospora costi]|uniref:Uncharacterized protein n=1 Tax=Micromonospora costi TaxID=1530042 RepID=A0A3B0A048_9ACTN|nr:hypothetical protein [Micromonospora costi]RKN53903.1 hypothetical protein D7193_17780 [Micromonospora costi]